MLSTEVQIMKNWCKMGLYFVIPGGNFDFLMMNDAWNLEGIVIVRGSRNIWFDLAPWTYNQGYDVYHR